MHLLLFILIVINAILVGLILVTQIVSYPLLLKVNKVNFFSYYVSYTNRISIVVVPLMLFEVVLTFLLYIYSPINTLIQLSVFLLLLIWMSTFLIQVPLHSRLSLKFDENLINKLISTNSIRTFLWISKLVFLCIYYHHYYNEKI